MRSTKHRPSSADVLELLAGSSDIINDIVVGEMDQTDR